jgi:hypothetical protein
VRYPISLRESSASKIPSNTRTPHRCFNIRDPDAFGGFRWLQCFGSMSRGGYSSGAVSRGASVVTFSGQLDGNFTQPSINLMTLHIRAKDDDMNLYIKGRTPMFARNDSEQDNRERQRNVSFTDAAFTLFVHYKNSERFLLVRLHLDSLVERLRLVPLWKIYRKNGWDLR